MDCQRFIKGLRNMRLDIIETCPKADLHNHTSRGGNVYDYMSYFRLNEMNKPSKFSSFDNMEKWYKDNMSIRFSNELYRQRIEWAFQQIKRDGIALAILTFGIAEIQLFESPCEFNNFVKLLKNTIIPNTNVIPELGIASDCNIKETAYYCAKIFECDYFRSIDVSGKEIVEPLNFLPIYKIAEAHAVRKRAHIGEFGSPNIIRKAIDILNLDEINHGINAVYDLELIKLIKQKNIRLNICPASNIQLGLSENYNTHPMRKLFDYGVDITLNTDDMLIFNVSLSQLYLDLYKYSVFSAEELNLLRENSLKAR